MTLSISPTSSPLRSSGRLFLAPFGPVMVSLRNESRCHFPTWASGRPTRSDRKRVIRSVEDVGVKVAILTVAVVGDCVGAARAIEPMDG